ncbi:hypothetical protein G6F56_002644 [Rhizopus delemar]|uniref:Uncharacterized protein n=1 Tax=Rhizopus stolonifer TaxID=4846 RepID=A0A367JGE3_RHIST|nr:hypothetical protein G6F56_002644 [Rhizopus delemar]RCH88791.1 hypothetical protein CU098_008134 [Rhizopus stolonifer]
MKLVTISTVAALVASVSASNHMNLAKRAYVTNVAVETVTVTEESYIFAYNGGKAANIVNNIQLALNGFIKSETKPSGLNCNDRSCPLVSIIGDFLLKELPKGLPSMTTALPGNARALNLDEIADQEEVKSNKAAPIQSFDASRIVAEAMSKLSTQSMSAVQPNDISSMIADAFKDINNGINNGAAEFASVAGHMMEDAQGAVNNLLNEYLS